MISRNCGRLTARAVHYNTGSRKRTVKAGPKTDRSLEGSGEEITLQKGNRLTDRPGRVSPWNAHPRRQEACVGGPHMEATFAAVRRETKSKRSMREDSCPEHQWEKMQLDPLKGKETKKEFFFVRARCLSAGLRSSVLLANQRGIEPPPAVCQRHKNAVIPTEPRGRLERNKKGKEGPVKFSGDSDQKQGYANQPSVGQKAQHQQPQQKPPVW